jgi:hypothetical protein
VTPPDPSPPEGAEAPSLTTLLRVLIEDALTMAEAEAGFWRAGLALFLSRIRRITLLLVIGLALLFFTGMALVLGLLLALAAAIGPWRALAVVVALLAVLGGGALAMAYAGMRHLARVLFGHHRGDGHV